MIDLHSHPLPGVDDGPATREGALAFARAAVAAGIDTLCATPHIEHALMVDPLEVPERTRAWQAELDAEGIGLRLVSSGEIAPPRAVELSDEELRALTFGDGDWLLLECPLRPFDVSLEPAAAHLMERGFRIVLAHPERSPMFLRDPTKLMPLVRRGVRCSITAGALRRQFGAPARRLAVGLLDLGFAHNVASDAHDTVRRPPEIAGALEEAERLLRGVGELTPWLTEEVPGAILAGEEPPPRPEVRLRKPLLRRA